MKLPIPNDQFAREVHRILEQEDLRNYKTNKDLEIGMNRVILTSPNGTRYAITVSNAGVISSVVV